MCGRMYGLRERSQTEQVTSRNTLRIHFCATNFQARVLRSGRVAVYSPGLVLLVNVPQAGIVHMVHIVHTPRPAASRRPAAPAGGAGGVAVLTSHVSMFVRRRLLLNQNIRFLQSGFVIVLRRSTVFLRAGQCSAVKSGQIREGVTT